MNKLINKRLLIVFVCVLFSGCASINRNFSNLFFPPYPNSDQRQGENTIAILDEKKCIDKFEPATLPGASVVAELAVKAVEKFLEDEAKRYTATYSASAVGGFFSCHGNDLNLKSITLKRLTTRYKSLDEPAMELVLGVRAQPDGMAFQIVPKKVLLRQSKAKVAAIDITRPFGFDILAPWTVFQAFQAGGIQGLSPLRPPKVDMKVELKLLGVWTDKEQKTRVDEIASRTLPLSVEIGQCIEYKSRELDQFGDLELGSVGKCPADLAKLDENDYLAIQKPELFGHVPRAWRFVDGAAPTLDGSYGNYIVTILVTEVDNFGERVIEVANKVKENEGTLIKSLQRLGE